MLNHFQILALQPTNLSCAKTGRWGFLMTQRTILLFNFTQNEIFNLQICIGCSNENWFRWLPKWILFPGNIRFQITVKKLLVHILQDRNRAQLQEVLQCIALAKVFPSNPQLFPHGNTCIKYLLFKNFPLSQSQEFSVNKFFILTMTLQHMILFYQAYRV